MWECEDYGHKNQYAYSPHECYVCKSKNPAFNVGKLKAQPILEGATFVNPGNHEQS